VLAFARPMEMVSRAHHYGVSRWAKACSRRMLECVMEKPLKPPRKRTRAVEVHVMFEPSRLAQQHLQDAYACLLPTVHRRVGHAQPPIKPASSRAERKVQ
jgi:hypothetical protein